MFILSRIQDKVEISSACRDKKREVFEKLNGKYANKVIKNLGLGIYVKEVERIYYYKISGSLLVAKTDFIILVFKFYNDELLCGKITSQSERGIEVELSFYGTIFIPRENMFKGFEVGTAELKNRTLFYWFWRYKGHKLYFNNEEMVRFKVKNSKKQVEGRIDETGLGPLRWWE